MVSQNIWLIQWLSYTQIFSGTLCEPGLFNAWTLTKYKTRVVEKGPPDLMKPRDRKFKDLNIYQFFFSVPNLSLNSEISCSWISNYHATTFPLSTGQGRTTNLFLSLISQGRHFYSDRRHFCASFCHRGQIYCFYNAPSPIWLGKWDRGAIELIQISFAAV